MVKAQSRYPVGRIQKGRADPVGLQWGQDHEAGQSSSELESQWSAVRQSGSVARNTQ